MKMLVPITWVKNSLLLVTVSSIVLLIVQINPTQQVSVVSPNIDQHTLLPNIEIQQKKPSSSPSSIDTNNDDDSLLLIDVNHQKRAENSAIRHRQHSLNYLLSVITVASPFSIHDDDQDRGQQLNLSDTTIINSANTIRASSLKKLNNLLNDSNHDHTSDLIDITLANDAWKLMQLNAQRYAKEKVEEARPTINQLLQLAGVSANCRQSISYLLDRLEHLDQWAVQSKSRKIYEINSCCD